MGKTKPYFQIITEGIRLQSACIWVEQSIGAPMHRFIHLGDIQIDTPVYERRFVTLHFSLFFKTSAKNLSNVLKTKVPKWWTT